MTRNKEDNDAGGNCIDLFIIYFQEMLPTPKLLLTIMAWPIVETLNKTCLSWLVYIPIHSTVNFYFLVTIIFFGFLEFISHKHSLLTGSNAPKNIPINPSQSPMNPSQAHDLVVGTSATGPVSSRCQCCQKIHGEIPVGWGKPWENRLRCSLPIQWWLGRIQCLRPFSLWMHLLFMHISKQI